MHILKSLYFFLFFLFLFFFLTFLFQKTKNRKGKDSNELEMRKRRKEGVKWLNKRELKERGKSERKKIQTVLSKHDRVVLIQTNEHATVELCNPESWRTGLQLWNNDTEMPWTDMLGDNLNHHITLGNHLRRHFGEKRRRKSKRGSSAIRYSRGSVSWSGPKQKLELDCFTQWLIRPFTEIYFQGTKTMSSLCLWDPMCFVGIKWWAPQV